MLSELDDELTRMDELEQEENREIREAVLLTDPLSSLDLPPPVVVPVGTSIRTAMEELQKRSIGCLLVEKDNKLIGIFTERDILLKITGKGLDFDREVIEHYMSENPEYLKIYDPIAYALNKMYVGGFRHVPLVNDQKTPIGMVSLVDIVYHISAYFNQEVLNLPPKPQRKGFPSPEGG